MSSRVGFIGVGIKSESKVKNLIKTGNELVAYDVNREPVRIGNPQILHGVGR